MLLAAFCHDFKHTGHNNTFHINSKSDLALIYNGNNKLLLVDVSVLENYHVSETFKLMKNNEADVLSLLSPEEYRVCRRRIIESILATDMGYHQKNLSATKARIEAYTIKKGQNIDRLIHGDNLAKTFENQQCVLNLVLHSADISSPTKSFKICDNWTQRIYSEFFKQGDAEKKAGLPVSLLCDRETTNFVKSQIGFISFVVQPTFDILSNFVPEIDYYMENLKKNTKKYEELANTKK